MILYFLNVFMMENVQNNMILNTTKPLGLRLVYDRNKSRYITILIIRPYKVLIHKNNISKILMSKGVLSNIWTNNLAIL